MRTKIFILVCAFLFVIPEAHAIVCPVVELECLAGNEHMTDYQRLDNAGARSWEIDAWDAIRSGNIGKNPLDMIDWSDTIGSDDRRHGWWDFGHYHLAYEPGDEDILGVGIRMGSPDWLAWTTAVLYADRAEWNYVIQLEEWRRKVSYAIRPAKAAGCRRSCLAVTAAIANSSPSLAVRLGRQTAWCPESMLDLYGTTPHRQRRVDWLRREVL